MESANIKKEIQKLIDTQNDPNILNAIYNILESAPKEAAIRDLMTARALKAEEDIKEGKVYTSDEFKTIITEHIKKR